MIVYIPKNPDPSRRFGMDWWSKHPIPKIGLVHGNPESLGHTWMLRVWHEYFCQSVSFNSSLLFVARKNVHTQQRERRCKSLLERYCTGVPTRPSGRGVRFTRIECEDYSGQISSRPHTGPSPQMVVKSKGIPRLFQGNLGWWKIIICPDYWISMNSFSCEGLKDMLSMDSILQYSVSVSIF